MQRAHTRWRQAGVETAPYREQAAALEVAYLQGGEKNR